MPHSHLHDLSEDLLQRAARVRLACFDVDGTLTDGRLLFDSEGRESKSFHVADGQGLAQLRHFGVRVAFVTARDSRVARLRGEELGAEVHAGAKDKLACVRELCERHGLALEQVSFMGDDLPDIPPMRHVGLSVAPANVHPWTRPHARWITRAAGGEGAARELCDLLLAAQGHVPALLAELER
ncbi:phenylphosphate carboxylase subunit delta [Pseudoxanthomonas kalamensis DSM 18571]|uniref:KdsC family phosphatase n=1 Tax=Pseudoxanthomonas kalamensis TaxID=289483 RepID=UPI001392005C|nr:HAD hydrolase family protein [Pseudoxanthomonas kalamensis]KAF1711426.1 phenylphosphate carboxylase subunit delta [Pseudoxanthomonas kalamensis DSM 18571]